MSRKPSNPDTVIAHVDLLRAVDDLIEEAERVREKRDALNRALAINTDKQCSKPKRATSNQSQTEVSR